MIDISIQSRTAIADKHESDQAEDQEDDEEDNGKTSSHDSMEHLHMIVVPTTNRLTVLLIDMPDTHGQVWPIFLTRFKPRFTNWTGQSVRQNYQFFNG